MFFAADTYVSEILFWVNRQLSAVLPVAQHGVDVDIKPHQNQRSNQQNRFLMAILVALVRFHQETGFCPPGVSPWGMRVDVLKVYYKDRFGVGKSSKLSTKTFGEFVDNIQRSLVEETGGEWQILEPDSAYMRALLESGGY